MSATLQDFCEHRSGKFDGDRKESLNRRVREENLVDLSQGGKPQSKQNRKSMLNDKIIAACVSMLNKFPPTSL